MCLEKGRRGVGGEKRACVEVCSALHLSMVGLVVFPPFPSLVVCVAHLFRKLTSASVACGWAWEKLSKSAVSVPESWLRRDTLFSLNVIDDPHKHTWRQTILDGG